jgi:hypothetical protein
MRKRNSTMPKDASFTVSSPLYPFTPKRLSNHAHAMSVLDKRSDKLVFDDAEGVTEINRGSKRSADPRNAHPLFVCSTPKGSQRHLNRCDPYGVNRYKIHSSHPGVSASLRPPANGCDTSGVETIIQIPGVV